MRIAGLNLAEFFGQATSSSRAGNVQAALPVTCTVHIDDPKSVAAKRVIDAEILTKSVTSPSPLDRRTPANPQPESLAQRQLLDKSGDQRVMKYLETFPSTDYNSLPNSSLDTYA
jgi:hypothetical protein